MRIPYPGSVVTVAQYFEGKEPIVYSGRLHSVDMSSSGGFDQDMTTFTILPEPHSVSKTTIKGEQDMPKYIAHLDRSKRTRSTTISLEIVGPDGKGTDRYITGGFDGPHEERDRHEGGEMPIFAKVSDEVFGALLAAANDVQRDIYTLPKIR